jgi:hypothetical protein
MGRAPRNVPLVITYLVVPPHRNLLNGGILRSAWCRVLEVCHSFAIPKSVVAHTLLVG